jgi:hypothetical protein
MTERLRDMNEFGSPDEAEAARLLCMLGPAAPSVSVEQRVYANLGEQRRFAPRVMRFAAVAAVPVLTMAVVGAALAMYAHRRAGTHEPTASVPLSPPTPTSLPMAGPATRAFAPLPDRPVTHETSLAGATPVEPALLRAEPRKASRLVPAPAPVVARRRNYDPKYSATDSAPSEAAAPTVGLLEATEARVSAAPPEEAALVLAGLRALRREHDPTRAGTLLARYVERFPQGVLAEEALAIAIEADLARGDRQAAAALAEQYLKRFPAGRFIRLARKTMDPPRQ